MKFIYKNVPSEVLRSILSQENNEVLEGFLDQEIGKAMCGIESTEDSQIIREKLEILLEIDRKLVRAFIQEVMGEKWMKEKLRDNLKWVLEDKKSELNL